MWILWGDYLHKIFLLVSGKNNKNIFRLSSADYVHSMLSIKQQMESTANQIQTNNDIS